MDDNREHVKNACQDTIDLGNFVINSINKVKSENKNLNEKDHGSLNSFIQQLNIRIKNAQKLASHITTIENKTENTMAILNLHTQALDYIEDCRRLNTFACNIVEKANKRG